MENTCVKHDLSIKDNLFYLYQRSNGIPVITDLKKYNSLIRRMDHAHSSNLKEANLKEKIEEIRDLIKCGADRDSIIIALFPLIAEACRRTLNLTPFAEQILCGIALSEGSIVQMNTGEGKTLAAVFAASYRALCGENVHILTANEYLAHRDAKWMAPVYNAIGLNVSSIGESMSIKSRKEAYCADVCYLTVRQAGFDFLHDNLTWDINERMQRPFQFCLVDEADFIMIDEARIPLVIAGAKDDFHPDPHAIREILPELEAQVHFTEDKACRHCNLTLAGQRKIENLLKCGAMENPESANWYAAVHVALHAEYQLHRDIHYIVRDGNILYVDEITGRIAEGRKWPDGIQSALEAKEGIKVQPEGRIYSTITIHGLINLYKSKSGMTATAALAADEFFKTYKLQTILIPPHNKSRLTELPDRIFATRNGKIDSIIKEVQHVHKTGQPLLIGTASILESELIGARLSREGIACQILNAKNDEQEAQIISKAGMWGAVTISTNMAGRGTDIKLGGEEGLLYEEINRLGGLYIIGTTRFESKRVDNQLMGRAARQGDRGHCRYFVSLEDDLVKRYGMAEHLKVDSLENGVGENKAIAGINNEIGRAQRIIESQHSSMRRHLARYSELMERQRKQLFLFREEILTHLNCLKNGDSLPVLPVNLPPEISSMIKASIQRSHNDIDKKKIELHIYSFILKEIDLFWSDQLSWASEKREAIHLVRYANKIPLHVYIKEMVELFDEGIDQIFSNIQEELESFSSGESRYGNEKEIPKGPSSTWTYQLNDNPFSVFNVFSLEGFGRTFILMTVKMFQGLLLLPLVVIKAFERRKEGKL